MARAVLGIRHGEVDNPRGIVYAGLPGYGLSERGRAEAAAVAEAVASLDVCAVYASPLDRARETAEIIAGAAGCGVVIDERLTEWRHWHQWAGMTWDELRESGRQAWEAYLADPGSVRSVESLDELAARMSSWLEDVRGLDGDVVVGVTHLEPLRATLLRALARPATDLFLVRIPTGGVVRLFPHPSPYPLTLEEVRELGPRPREHVE